MFKARGKFLCLLSKRPFRIYGRKAQESTTGRGKEEVKNYRSAGTFYLLLLLPLKLILFLKRESLMRTLHFTL